MFVGRDKELEILNRLKKTDKASLVICRGRRRIGKSRLIQEFGKSFSHFYEFQGLAPRKEINKKSQLENFSQLLGAQFDLPDYTFKNWTEAFALLAKQTTSGRVLIFLDEISWMAQDDPDFVGQLKIAWDTKFKKNNKLILVICGSVSSWIDKNILNSTDFVGRVSATISLKELSLNYCNCFWSKSKGQVSAYEKFKLLCITGGVPRYLEEIDINDTAEHNIKDMCFNSNGVLFDEFDKIFNDIFSKKASSYKKIVGLLAKQKLSFTGLCQKLKTQANGVISDYLQDLEMSGFIVRDYTYHLNGKQSKLSQYRLHDNYLRYYLKYIEPNKQRIKESLFDFVSLDSMKNWETIFGFQFENLVLNNRNLLYKLLKIDKNTIISSSPYFQNKTNRLQPCQIDLLIHTKNSLYVCEIKFRKNIKNDVINETKEKIKRLKIPEYLSVRPVLIYAGQLAESVKINDYFYRIIDFADIL